MLANETLQNLFLRIWFDCPLGIMRTDVMRQRVSKDPLNTTHTKCSVGVAG